MDIQFLLFIHSLQKSNRGMKTQKSPVHNMAETLNIDVRTPENLKGNLAEYNFLEELNADIAIVVAYGKILPENFLPLAKKRLYKHTCINLTILERVLRQYKEQ